MSGRQRRQLFVDGKVQGALALRAAFYWAYCLLSVALMMVCWIVLVDHPSSSGEVWRRLYQIYFPALAASLLVLPIVMIDLLRLTNRFAGPIKRLRRAVKQLAEGEHVAPLEFRDGDFWTECADDFNQLLRRIQHLETLAAPADQQAAAGSADHGATAAATTA